jgi:single-stranded DNA-specific DHH superfamily exonuclease
MALNVSMNQVLEPLVKTIVNLCITKLAEKFNLDEKELIEEWNLPPEPKESDKNLNTCPYIPENGKNKGKACGKKCKGQFCPPHNPETIEKKKQERENKGKEKKEQVNIEGDNADDIINNIYIGYEDPDKDKTLKGTMTRQILESIINKQIVQHEQTDDEDYEKYGYPVEMTIANTKLKMIYQDGKGLNKALIPQKKSNLTEDQQTQLYKHINEIKVMNTV